MKAIEVADNILYEVNKNHIKDITPLKLQKLLFLVFVDYILNHNALPDVDFEVWKHGPVNLEVYKKYRVYRSSVIEKIGTPVKDILLLNSINRVIDEYGEFDAWRLVEITHSTDGLWYKKLNSGEKFINARDIEAHYKNRTN